MSRALVLGGGGPVGIAWECGLLAGLAQAGVDLGTADFILGTSAGSFVGARLAMGAEAAGKEFAVTVRYTGPTDETKIQEQIDMVQAAVDSRPDAIVLAACDYIQLVNVVDRAV
jgi:ABC-type sugar transport system substrate-binding protein